MTDGNRLIDRIKALPQYTEDVFTHEKWPDINVHVRSVSVGSRSQWLDKINKQRRGDQITGINVVTFEFLKEVCYDSEGNPMFAQADLATFNTFASDVIDALFEFARDMSGMLDSSTEEAKNS